MCGHRISWRRIRCRPGRSCPTPATLTRSCAAIGGLPLRWPWRRQLHRKPENVPLRRPVVGALFAGFDVIPAGRGCRRGWPRQRTFALGERLRRGFRHNTIAAIGADSASARPSKCGLKGRKRGVDRSWRDMPVETLPVLRLPVHQCLVRWISKENGLQTVEVRRQRAWLPELESVDHDSLMVQRAVSVQSWQRATQ